MLPMHSSDVEYSQVPWMRFLFLLFSFFKPLGISLKLELKVYRSHNKKGGLENERMQHILLLYVQTVFFFFFLMIFPTKSPLGGFLISSSCW